MIVKYLIQKKGAALVNAEMFEKWFFNHSDVEMTTF